MFEGIGMGIVGFGLFAAFFGALAWLINRDLLVETIVIIVVIIIIAVNV